MAARVLLLVLLAGAAGAFAGAPESAPANRGVVRAPDRAAALTPAPRCGLPAALGDEFTEAAADARLPLELLVAVAKVESGLRPDARSPAGAYGLLQVLPSTAAELGLDPYRVRENVLAGARYLRRMLDRFRSAELALAAYNAGPGAVERRGARPYAETVAYVARVTAEWRKLVGCA